MTLPFGHRFAASLVMLLVPISIMAQQPGTKKSAPLTPQELFKRVAPSVFVVEVLDAGGEVIAVGSGVAVARDQVVTNKHVVDEGISFRIRQGEMTWAAKVTHASSDYDLARLLVEGLSARPVNVRESSTLEVGERVFAVGAPEGLETTFSDGIISALRDFADGRLIQVTTPISQGSSGGGLFDAHGRLVGITTSGMKEGQNLNFAVPAEWITGLEQSQVSGTLEAAEEDSFLRWFMLAYAYHDDGEYQKAIDAYQEAIRLKPNHAKAWYNLGVNYGDLGEYQKAIDAYREAIRLQPDDAKAWSNLGVHYGDLGEYQKAIDAFREAIRLQPDLADAWNNLGAAYGDLDQSQKEIDAYREAIRLQPDYVRAWHNLGATYGQLGQYQEALQAFREAIRFQPDLAEAWFGLGAVYGQLDQSQKALEAHREAIRLQQDYPDAWYGLGYSYGQLGQSRKAQEAYREAIRLQPNHASAWYGLGLTYEKLDQRSKVMEVYERLKVLDKELADEFFNEVVLP